MSGLVLGAPTYRYSNQLAKMAAELEREEAEKLNTSIESFADDDAFDRLFGSMVASSFYDTDTDAGDTTAGAGAGAGTPAGCTCHAHGDGASDRELELLARAGPGAVRELGLQAAVHVLGSETARLLSSRVKMRRFAHMLPSANSASGGGSGLSAAHPRDRAEALIAQVQVRCQALADGVARQRLATALLQVQVQAQQLVAAQHEQARLRTLAQDARGEAQLLLAKLQSGGGGGSAPELAAAAMGRADERDHAAGTRSAGGGRAPVQTRPRTSRPLSMGGPADTGVLAAATAAEARAFIESLAESKLLPDSGPYVVELKGMLGRALQKLSSDLCVNTLSVSFPFSLSLSLSASLSRARARAMLCCCMQACLRTR